MDKFSQGPNYGSMQNRERKGLNYTLCQLNIFLLNSVVKVEFQISDSWNLGREGITPTQAYYIRLFKWKNWGKFELIWVIQEEVLPSVIPTEEFVDFANSLLADTTTPCSHRLLESVHLTKGMITSINMDE